MRRPVRSLRRNATPGPSRLALALACASGLLLAACASPRATPSSAGLQPAKPASNAPDHTPSYRLDAARHLYGQNRERVYAGVMPHYLRAVGVLEMSVDAQGQVDTLRWLRAPTHAPEVMAEIERLVRQAAPYPAPAPSALQGGSARVIETWLWDQSGRFQLRTLSEGQGETAPTAGTTQLATQGAVTPNSVHTPPVIWQPVRVHLVAADGR
jgi:protein TonB